LFFQMRFVSRQWQRFRLCLVGGRAAGDEHLGGRRTKARSRRPEVRQAIWKALRSTAPRAQRCLRGLLGLVGNVFTHNPSLFFAASTI
jgi:hypothetical protein